MVKTIHKKLEAKQKTVWLKETREARDITQEILRYGVSQNQIRNIIKLLALELDDVDAMRAISQILTENINEQPDTVNILKPGGETDE